MRTHPTIARLLPLALALSVGCGFETALRGDDLDAGANDTVAPVDADTAIPEPTRTYWGIAGDLVVTKGVVDVAASTLELQTRGTECVLRATLEAADEPNPRPVDAAGLVSWWTCTVVPDPEATCTWPAATTFGVGLGVSDAELQPAADRVGLDANAAYGLYLSQADAIYLVGIAGTSDVLEGSELPVTEAPLPDGTYRLVTLHGLPVP